jgi:hypothetical protein
MKKTLFTLDVGKYEPKITALTFPFLERYAEKIGADFHVITERKFPQFAPVYEKLQIYELGRGSDWNIFFDADTLVHPDLFDVTNHLDKDTVLHWSSDMAGNRWRYDNYFRRDGRHIGSGNWFSVASDWCLDLWHPLDDLTPEQAIGNIFPTVSERNLGIHSEHLIDDYTLSRNIAKYGLKFKSFQELQKELKRETENYFFHNYMLLGEQKLAQMKGRIRTWELNGSAQPVEAELAIQ